MLKGQDIVIVGQQAWDIDIGSNCKDIALQLSKYNNVLYVNAPLDRITKMRSKRDPKIRKRINIIKRRKNGLEKVKDNLWILYPDVMIESINWIHLNSLFSYFNLINNKRFSKAIMKAISILNFANYLLFNDNDIFRSFYLKELLKPKLSIYYIRDYMIATPYWKRHGTILEPLLMEKSDLVLSNSEFLRGYGERYNRNSYFVAQGCDFDSLLNTEFSCPNDMENISTPIIGYFGVLTSLRLDISLIEYIADSFPEFSIVLVGPEDSDFEKSSLHRRDNVHFLGKKSPDEIFRYIDCFDICINPQLINELTIGNYPRKIDEYLAVGKPVVATWTEAMEFFRDFVYLACDYDMFVTMIKDALAEDNLSRQNGRKEFAYSHNWENAVNSISENIQKHLSHESRTPNYDA